MLFLLLLLSNRQNAPFRHPDFSDDQIRQLTEIARSCKSSPSVTSRRSGQHSGCSSPALSPTVQRLRSQGFAPLARCGSDPLLTGAPPQTAMNTGSLPAELLPQSVSFSPSVPSSGVHPRHTKTKSERHKSKDYSPKISLGTTSTSERELITLLVNRLMAAETQLSYARQTIRQREFHITVLEEKLRLYMKAEEDAVGSRAGFLDSLKDSRLAHIDAKCARLERQVMEMERFLGEFGMVWCEEENTYIMDPSLQSGSSSESDATSRTASPARTLRGYPRGRMKRSRRNRELRRIVVESTTSRSISSEAEPFILDYDLLLAGITEVNLQTQGDAVAEGGESMQFTLYKNGFVMGDDAPFRSFDQMESRRILQDLLDGVFPSELQDLYPNGAPIKVRDKRQVIFLPKSRSKKEGSRPPVPPKPPLTQGDSGLTFSSLTSVTSLVGGSVSETDSQVPPGPEDLPADVIAQTLPTTESVLLCPEIENKSESSDLSSRRNSLQRASDRSEGETKAESSSRRGSEVLLPPEPPPPLPPPPPVSISGTKESAPRAPECRRVSEVQRVADLRRTSIIAEGRRGSEARRMSDARRLTEGRRGSEYRIHSCRRRSDARRLDFDFGRRIPTKHPLDWNRINRGGFPMHDDVLDPNVSQLRRGSVGVSIGGDIATEPYDIDSLRKRRTSVEDFLSKVPACVVKSGKLINLREEVADMIMGSQRKNSMTLVHTPVLDEAGESQEGTDPDEESPKAEAAPLENVRTTLRIKVENGSETYLIKLKGTDSIETLRNYLKSYRGVDQDFEIVKPYPYEVLSKPEATMIQLGLVPNAVLHLKSKTTSGPSTSELLQTVIGSSAVSSSSFCPFSTFTSHSGLMYDRDKLVEGAKESQDSGVGALSSLSKSQDTDFDATASFLSSIIAPSSAVTMVEMLSSKRYSLKGGPLSSSYSQATICAAPTATPSPTPSPRHSPCPPLTAIPPNLHPAIPPPVPILCFSEDLGIEPTTVVTTTCSSIF